jgi:AraC-like DNA-binding protein
MGYHTHNFYELNLILSGEGRHFIENQSWQASRGCVFMIPPGVRHGYRKKSENFDVYHLLIHRDFLDVYMQEFSKTIGFSLLFEIEPYLRVQYSEKMFLKLSEEEISTILSDIRAIGLCDGISDADLYKNAIAKKLLVQLCLYFTKRHGFTDISPASTKELGAIADTLHYIHQNFGEHLSVALLCKRVNMSRSTFLRHFEKVCGCTPHQYLSRYRLQKANEFLKTQKPFTETALLCGFYDASHLRKALQAQ